jgi:pentatricopeptide repeat protein
MLSSWLHLYAVVKNFMVDLFAKCGKIGYAQKMFDEMLRKKYGFLEWDIYICLVG